MAGTDHGGCGVDQGMTQQAPEFAYSNLSPRPAGPFYRAAARLLPGVGQVQAQIEPYARAWQRANAAALAAGGPLWAVLGDSMSQGIGASRYDRGWVGQLGRELASRGYPVRIVNLSVSGARVADVLDTQLPAMARLGVRPELVTLLIGSNDIMRRRHRAGLAVAFSQLLDRLPDGAVVAGMPNRNPAARAINELIDRATSGGPGRDGRLILADMRSGGPGSWRGRLAGDHFHPNDLGYAGLASAFAGPALARLRAIGAA